MLFRLSNLPDIIMHDQQGAGRLYDHGPSRVHEHQGHVGRVHEGQGPGRSAEQGVLDSVTAQPPYPYQGNIHSVIFMGSF